MNLTINPSPSTDNQLKIAKITKEIIDCFSCADIFGKFTIQPTNTYDRFHIILMHFHMKTNSILEVFFPEKFPQETIKVNVFFNNAENLIQSFSYIPIKQKSKLKDILLHIYQQIEQIFKSSLHDNHSSENYKDCSSKVTKSAQTIKVEEDEIVQCFTQQKQYQQNQTIKIKKTTIIKRQVKKTIDNQLTETKNLNRHFRSKLRQVHKDLINNQKPCPDALYIEKVFNPNRVGFQDIRKALQNQWFNNAVKQQINTGKFIHRILRGMMGVKSKKLMIKYFHVMASAVQQPENFTRWKYQ